MLCAQHQADLPSLLLSQRGTVRAIEGTDVINEVEVVKEDRRVVR